MLERFEYKRATMEDIEELVRTRIIVLRAVNKLSDDVDMPMVEKVDVFIYRLFVTVGEKAMLLENQSLVDDSVFI